MRTSILDTIGSTPLVRLDRLARHTNGEILAKLEFFNPLSSVKDRIALAMIDEAERSGKLQPGGSVIEASSGNTGIALAFICARRGYPLYVTMPESMSYERQLLLKHFGAELILTPASEGMRGAQRKAEELIGAIPGAFMPRQFENPANPAVHRARTGPEIWTDTRGTVDVFVAGVGTGGTITGVGQFLKSLNPAIRIVAVEPAESPVLSGGDPGSHKIQGIGAGFVPSVLDRNVLDEIVTISSEEAIETAQRLASEEGIPAGISSGAAVAAAIRLASRKEFEHHRIVTILPSSAERYMTTSLFGGIDI